MKIMPFTGRKNLLASHFRLFCEFTNFISKILNLKSLIIAKLVLARKLVDAILVETGMTLFLSLLTCHLSQNIAVTETYPGLQVTFCSYNLELYYIKILLRKEVKLK